MLAMDFQSPLFWAVLLAWILTVVLHEFAHGLVAYMGGDYTIAERGGLTLNPLAYVDPFFSLLMPAVLLLLGGIPLPGGVTYIRRDLLRSRLWSTAVSLAGPGMNLLLFFAFALPFHPRIGWVHPSRSGDWSNYQVLAGAMALLQLVTVLFNLVPVPPLDGFQAIGPYLDANTRTRLSTPPLSTILFLAFFLVLWKVPGLMSAVFEYVIVPFLRLLGFGYREIGFFGHAYNRALFSATD
jgi:Zn-dependent protease